MSTFILTVLIFLSIFKWVVIISVLISWIGVKIQTIESMLDPIYEFIEKYIPTKIGPISFTPIIIIFAIEFLALFIFAFDPNIKQQYLQLINF